MRHTIKYEVIFIIHITSINIWTIDSILLLINLAIYAHNY